MPLYNIFRETNGYRVAKWSDMWDLEASYLVTSSDCDCPSRRKPCKHVALVGQAIAQKKVDTQEFFDPDTASWHLFVPEDQTFPKVQWRRV